METPDTHNQIMYKLGQIEGKLDANIATTQGIKSDVATLDNKFSTLEAGRLSRLELSFNTLKTETSVKAKWTGMWTAAGISVAVGIISVLITHFIK